MGTGYAPQAVWYSWMADVTAHDLQLRAITTGFMNSFDFAFVTWWPLVFFPVTDAPHFHKGYIASLVTGALTLPVILTIAYLEWRGRGAGTIGRPLDESIAANAEQDLPSILDDGDRKVGYKTESTIVEDPERLNITERTVE